MDAAVIGGDLPGLLEAAVREPVDGLLGYSFLKHFRVAMDYPRGAALAGPDPGVTSPTGRRSTATRGSSSRA